MSRYPDVEFLSEEGRYTQLMKLIQKLEERAENLEDMANNLLRQIRRRRRASREPSSASISVERAISNPRDPPCAICGTMTDDILCPNCKTMYGWILE